MTRTLELLALGAAIGGTFGIPFGWWLRFENELRRRATGETIEFDRKRIGA